MAFELAARELGNHPSRPLENSDDDQSVRRTWRRHTWSAEVVATCSRVTRITLGLHPLWDPLADFPAIMLRRSRGRSTYLPELPTFSTDALRYVPLGGSNTQIRGIRSGGPGTSPPLSVIHSETWKGRSLHQHVLRILIALRYPIQSTASESPPDQPWKAQSARPVPRNLLAGWRPN